MDEPDVLREEHEVTEMEVERKLTEIIGALNDYEEYIVFFASRGKYRGSFRVERSSGSEIKKKSFLFDFFDHVEIFPNSFESEPEIHDNAELTTFRRIEYLIEDSYTQLREEECETDLGFIILRTTPKGVFIEQKISGRALVRNLIELMKDSKTLTIVETKSGAEKLLNETLKSSGRIRLHKGERHISELSPEERSQYLLDDDEKSDTAESDENINEHHPE